MRSARLFAAGFCSLVSLILLGAGPLAAQDNSPPPPGEAAWETIVLPVRYKPATELANALARIFQDVPDVAVSADTVSNSLLIRTTTARKAQMLELLATLDRRPRMADITIVLLKAEPPLEDPAALSGTWEAVSATIADLQAQQRAQVARRLQLAALENEKAMVQIGEIRPVLVGSTASRGGFRGSRVVQNRDFGTLVSLMMRCPEAERLLLELKFELSEPQAAAIRTAPATDEEQADTPPPDDFPGVTTIVYESTLELPSDSAKLVHQAVQPVAGERSQAFYLIVAAALRGGDSPPQPAAALSWKSPPPVAPIANSPVPMNSGGPAVTELAGESPRAVSPASPSPPPEDAAQRTLRFARAYLLRYDRDGSGNLERSEWAGAVGMNEGVDLDANQVITTEEVAVWLEKNQLSAAPPQQETSVERGSLADYTMQRYDSDQSGALEQSEWAKMRPSPASADANRDQVISVAELEAWLRRSLRERAGEDTTSTVEPRPPAQPAPRLDERFLRIASEMFRKYDGNGDGKLDAAEQARMPRPPQGADTDGDNFVSPAELAAYYQGQ